MPTTRYRRKFSAGSRPAPDPYDKFLDVEGFYRKHTARDSSCLFRAISEQMFDTQDYYEKVRKDCVNYMIKHRDQFENLITIDFDQYMCEMSKLKSYGTVLELRAMGHLYKRNILLFQPYDLGIWLINETDYTDQCFRIFFAPEKHFDSVFTKPFIVKAAFCQSICYEILYKNVFKLPDVEYSVETMLHYGNDQESNAAYLVQEYGNDNYASHIVLDDGQKFQLDRPENTLCILDNYLLCHFHNNDFQVISEQFETSGNPIDILNVQRILNASLPDKYVSCVRQLLNEGITPFPYKVAKALDPDIYRNIEFDCWSDFRKESRSKPWYTGGWNFEVGVKCLVKLNETQEDFFKCHIQEMSPNKGPCIVFIEELAEKRSVPYNALQPLNDAKPWSLPTRRFARNRFSYDSHIYSNSGYTNRNGLRSDKSYYKNRKYADSIIDRFDYTKNTDDTKCRAIEKICDLDPYTNLSNFQPYPYEIVAMPMGYSRGNSNNANNSNNNNGKTSNSRGNVQGHVVAQQGEKQTQVQLTKIDEENAFNSNNLHDQNQQPQQQQQMNPQQQLIHQQQAQDQQIDPSMPPPTTAVPYYTNSGQLVQYYCPGSEYGDQGYYSVPTEMMPAQAIYTLPPGPYPTTALPANAYGVNSSISGNQMYPYPVPVGGWPPYNAPINHAGYIMPSAQAMPVTLAGIPPLPIIRRDVLQSNGRVNINANHSYAPTGEDLPVNDKATLRFFYNLGIEYFKFLQSTHGIGPLMSLIEGDNQYGAIEVSGDLDNLQNQMTVDFQQMGVDENEPENNIQTPVKGKGHIEYGHNLRRNPNPKYKRDGKSNQQRYYGSYPHQGGSLKPSGYKGGPKHHGNHLNMSTNSGNNSYDSTPVKEPGTKPHHYNNSNSAKRENQFVNGSGVNGGYQAHAAPFVPYYSIEANDQQYMPQNVYPQPGYPRMTPQQMPPRSASVPVAASSSEQMAEISEPYNAGYYNQCLYPQAPLQAAMLPHHHMAQNFWQAAPSHAGPPQQSLNSSNVSSGSSNTNSASNPSQ